LIYRSLVSVPPDFVSNTSSVLKSPYINVELILAPLPVIVLVYVSCVSLFSMASNIYCQNIFFLLPMIYPCSILRYPSYVAAVLQCSEIGLSIRKT
jgi:hypothetical protein